LASAAVADGEASATARRRARRLTPLASAAVADGRASATLDALLAA
jgi:hypothetical protein